MTRRAQQVYNLAFSHQQQEKIVNSKEKIEFRRHDYV